MTSDEADNYKRKIKIGCISEGIHKNQAHSTKITVTHSRETIFNDFSSNAARLHIHSCLFMLGKGITRNDT